MFILCILLHLRKSIIIILMFANVSPIFSPIMFINDHQCCSNVLSLCRQVSNMAEIGAGTKNRPTIPSSVNVLLSLQFFLDQLAKNSSPLRERLLHGLNMLKAVLQILLVWVLDDY